MVRRHNNNNIRSLEEEEKDGIPLVQDSVHEDEVRHNLNLEEKYGEII